MRSPRIRRRTHDTAPIMLVVALIVGSGCSASTPPVEESPVLVRAEDATPDPEPAEHEAAPAIEEPSLTTDSNAEEAWFPAAWPEGGTAGDLSRETRQQIEAEIETHYGMTGARLRSAGPAGGFVYVFGDISGETFYWVNGKLHDSDEFHARFRDTLRSK